MSDTHEELRKEIVQPLKHGHDVSNPITTLSNTEGLSKLHCYEQKRSLEQAIMAYSGPDPLEPWLLYIQFVEENYPRGGKEGDLLKVIGDCLEAMKGSVQYRSDGRLLEVHLQFLNLTERDVQYYNQLFLAGYFHDLAVFYISWADAAEAANDFKEGTRIYQCGMSNKAKPANKLEESYKLYQARVAKVYKSINCMPPEKSGDERNALGKLESKTMLRSGAPNSTSSTDIPFDLADLLVQVKAEAEAELFEHRQIAGEEEDQASPNCSPLLPDEVDVTVPLLVNALVRNLHIQSTPMPTKNRPSIPVSEDATPNFPSSKIQPIVPEGVEQLSASALAAISKSGLCPTGEISQKYFSSSGSGAGTTGLASHLSVVFSLFPTLASADIQMSREYASHSALYLACERGDLKTVKNCIEIRGADVNARVGRSGFNHLVSDESGTEIEASPLFIASLNKRTDVVKYLVERGAKVTAGLCALSSLNAGLTPLHAAFYSWHKSFDSARKEDVSRKQLEIIRCLAGADPSVVRPNGWFPIWMMGGIAFYTPTLCHDGSLIDSTFWCNPRAVHLLLELGMNVTQRFPYGKTILHQMAGPALMDDTEVFKFLLEKDLDLNARDDEGITPIMAAAIGNNNIPNISILKLLLERGDITNIDKISALEVAAAVLLSYFENLFHENDEYANRHEDMVNFLILAKTLRLQESCPLKAEEEKIVRVVESFTPVDNFQQLRERSSDYVMYSILIRLRVLSSISWGAFRHYLWPYIGRRYLNLGPFNFRPRKKPKTDEKLDICRKILEMIRRQDKTKKGVYDIVFCVVSMVLHTFTQLFRYNDPLFSPTILESTLDLLMQAYQVLPPPGEETYLRRESRDYLLKFYHLILMLDDLPDAFNTQKVKDFVSHIVRLNGRDSDGRSLLHYATQKPSSKVLGVIDLLVRNGIDADAVDQDGNGALHYFAMMKRNCIQCEAAARLLLDHGAHLDRVNNEGKTAADIWHEEMGNDRSGTQAGGSNADRPDWLNEGVPQLKCLAARVSGRLDLHLRVLNKDGLPKLPPTLVSFVGMHRR